MLIVSVIQDQPNSLVKAPFLFLMAVLLKFSIVIFSIFRKFWKMDKSIEKSLMNSLDGINRYGWLKIFNNYFSCITIPDRFSFVAHKILAPLGFKLPENVQLKNSPTHISILTSLERRQMDFDRAYHVWKKWRGKGMSYNKQYQKSFQTQLTCAKHSPFG